MRRCREDSEITNKTLKTCLALALLVATLAAAPVQQAVALPRPRPELPVAALSVPAAAVSPAPLLLLGPRPAAAPLLVADASTQLGHKATAPRRNGLVSRLSRRPQLLDAQQAARLIAGGDHVWVPVGQVTSNLILKELASQVKEPARGITPDKPVRLVALSNTASRSVFDREGKIVQTSLFLGANARDSVASGKSSFVPAYFHRIPRLIREGKVPVDVALVQVSKPDKLGYITLGPTAGATVAALEQAKVVIAEVNEHVPRTKGATRIHQSKVDYFVKGNEPLTEISAATITETDSQIAKHVVKLVLGKKVSEGKWSSRLKRAISKLVLSDDLPTFQFGIGGIPDAVATQLAESQDLQACRVRSELIGAGTRKLVESGKVRGKVRYTFAMGDQEFLKWMDKNAKLVSEPVEKLNDPSEIGKVHQMVAINSAISVDLNGQVNAQYVKDMWYSGVGGQVDFMRGAMTSPEGKAIIALPSVAAISDGKGGKKLISKIVPRLGEKDVITTNMHDVQYVVTEHGVAHLEGKNDVERASALIQIAHPQFRPGLREALSNQLFARQAAEARRYEGHLQHKQAKSAE